MSYPAMAWARTIKTGSSTNKSVLLAVANYANEDGTCWPSQERLAEDTELSRRSIMRALEDLEKAGHIIRERRHRSDGSRKTDLIRLNLSDAKAHSKNTQSDTAPTQSDTVPTQGDNVSTPRCHVVTAEPFIEPLIEPTKEPSDILVGASVETEFEEFWQAYPKRSPHPNPKHPAKLKYVNARKVHNVPHETLMTAARAYAASVAKKDREMIAQAQTWLNQRRWEDDYTGPVSEPKASKPEAPAASDADLDAIVSKYPGVVSDRAAASKALAAELSKGTELKAIIEAVEKYKLYIQQMKQDDVPIAPSILETWLRFKWREMDAYFIYRNPVQRYPVLKPVSEKPKRWGKV